MVHVAAPALSTRGLKIFFAQPQKPVDTHNRRVYISAQMQRGTGRNNKETDMTAADVKEMMDVFNAIKARAAELYQDADAEEIQKITATILNRSLGIE